MNRRRANSVERGAMDRRPNVIERPRCSSITRVASILIAPSKHTLRLGTPTAVPEVIVDDLAELDDLLATRCLFVLLP